MSQAASEPQAKRLKSCSTEVEDSGQMGIKHEEISQPPIKAEDVNTATDEDEDAESTELKLAILSSLHPNKAQDVLMDYLLAYNGDVEKVSEALSSSSAAGSKSKRQHSALNGYQSSIDTFAASSGGPKPVATATTKSLVQKGKTLHLYSPADIERHTPCSLVHNFLPQPLASALLEELLAESATFLRNEFQMFERTVTTNHTWRLYLDDDSSFESQQSAMQYDGTANPLNVRKSPPEMIKVSHLVKDAVNAEVARRTRDYQPASRRLKFQSPDAWSPNASIVNCYDGAKEGMGFHADTLTQLGTMPIIGSLSMGVTREFRVRRIVAQDDASTTRADEQGQIAIHLPHNSLLVMHASMQEEWKHCIAPTATITQHPVAGSKRFNITYRHFPAYMNPQYTPKCRCGVACVLRCVMKSKETRGRYMWQCISDRAPGGKSCGLFLWAVLDEDGRPEWAEGFKGNANGTAKIPEDKGDKCPVRNKDRSLQA
ncbi:unnamed protein product [Zymoseptoria tritici ST99CH_1A5]|uniref:Uncharacterized protein n=3 Tax=Zymoseptoria tritici TaxID=1047171 RepID=A0A1X7RW48_ZYMT9|nr:unnamed protein product [Zymoseptoria tritici ST99CH_3D7]SMR53851.1 unnamed protein product [Zymoseptoria tritici ST99CH_1E4]SMR56107.1 unnamed protein product [Zymoseptoria tritici ST99CH_3D1]SMY25292.1 unnamed protein product [Zymoseptoria tritici ST99CH_1A5]